GGIDFLDRGEGHLGGDLAGRRIGDVTRAAALARDRLVVDIVPDARDHDFLRFAGVLALPAKGGKDQRAASSTTSMSALALDHDGKGARMYAGWIGAEIWK